MERQNRSRSAHLNLAYSRLRPWRLHIHELVFDFLYRLQGKFLRFFRRQPRMDTNREQRRQPRITQMTRIKGATAEISYGAGRGYFDRMNRIFRMGFGRFCRVRPIFCGLSVISASGAAGSSDTKGKAAKGSGERSGSRASFKSVVLLFVSIRVHSWLKILTARRSRSRWAHLVFAYSRLRPSPAALPRACI